MRSACWAAARRTSASSAGADGPTDIIVSEEGGEQAAQDGEAVSPEDLDLGPAVTGIETIAADSGAVTEDGSYNTRDTVALYLMRYGTLPQNFITKSEAQTLGWEGGSLMDYAPG